MPKRKSRDEGEPVEISDTGVVTESPVDGLAGVNVQAAPDGSSFVDMEETETVSFRVNKQTKKLHNPRSRTLENLKAVNEANPELTPGYGEIKLDSSSVPDFMVNAVYQLLGGIEQWVFARKYGHEIAQIMAYRPQDIAMLSEPTKAVLAKYLPKLGRYQEETALVMALASIHIGKVQAMNAMLEAQEVRNATVTEIKPAPQNPVN